MWCEIKQDNWNISIKWNCGNISISSMGEKMEEARNYDIKWDLEENIDTISKYVKISWSVPEWKRVKTVSGDIDIWSDNMWEVRTISGDIDILWNNNVWKIETVSGFIDIWGDNMWEVRTVSGDIDIWIDNKEKVISNSWDIKAITNYWTIETNSWSVILEKNTWVVTTFWEVIVWENFRAKLRGVSISLWNSSIIGKNIIINNSWWQNISINNWGVYINWVKQEKWDKSESIIELWELEIDISKKEVYLKGKKISRSQARELGYDIEENFKSFKYCWQKVMIMENGSLSIIGN